MFNMAQLFNNVIAAGTGGPLDANFIANITGIVVFVVALVALRILVWPKITAGLDERNEKIISEIQSAEEAREQAKSALEDYERELSRAREEASKMIADARTQAKELADELKAQNEQELAERMQRANADIESAKVAAVAELHGHAAELATNMAGKILGREISVQDQTSLVEESLAELGKMN